MNTAETVAENVPGFAGPATLYRIDPPIKGTDHVLLFYTPPIFGQQGQLNVILATERGTVFGRDVRPQQGSYVTDEPNHYLALQLAGGYQIVDAPEPEPEYEIVEAEPLYEPADHTVVHVNEYLDGADETERERVLDAERNGKARKTILTRWQQ